VISQTGEYALRAVVDLSYHYNGSRTARQIAQATRVPAGYLAKVLQDLSRRGIVRSQRGLGGGFALARDPSRITVLDVLNAVDLPQRIRTCPLGLASHRDKLCPLHRKLDEAMAAAERAFREATIADVTSDVSSKPLRESATPLTISGGLAVKRPSKRKTARRSTK
jgi:Rrf2 family nitric oxide-sensitive transcriptional repressor